MGLMAREGFYFFYIFFTVLSVGFYHTAVTFRVLGGSKTAMTSAMTLDKPTNHSSVVRHQLVPSLPARRRRRHRHLVVRLERRRMTCLSAPTTGR